MAFRPTTASTLLLVSAAFVAAVAAHALFEQRWLPPAWWAGAVVLLLCAAALLSVQAWARMSALVLAAFAAGLWRYDAVLVAPAAPAVGNAKMFEAVVEGLPDWRVSGTEAVVVRDDGVRLAVKSSLALDALHGDRLRFACTPAPLDPEKRPSVTRLVLLDQIAAECRIREPPILLSRGSASPLRLLYQAKAAFRQRVRSLFPEPDASMLLGLLAGDDGGVPKGIKDSFRATGTSHILAVSGYNVTKLVGLLLPGVALLLVPRRKAALASIACVAAFVVFAGAEASIVRAGIMGSFALLATACGRRYGMGRALVLSAAVMLAMNPLVLRYDLGFGLSFAAVWGLMAFAAPATRLFFFLPTAGGVRSMAGETGGATLATVPLSLFAFGSLPLLGLVANLFVLPLIPWAMVTGFLACVVSLISPLLARPLAFLASLIIRVVLQVIHWCERHASYAYDGQISLGAMIGGYVGLACLWLFLKKRYGEEE